MFRQRFCYHLTVTAEVQTRVQGGGCEHGAHTHWHNVSRMGIASSSDLWCKFARLTARCTINKSVCDRARAGGASAGAGRRAAGRGAAGSALGVSKRSARVRSESKRGHSVVAVCAVSEVPVQRNVRSVCARRSRRGRRANSMRSEETRRAPLLLAVALACTLSVCLYH